MQAYEFNTIVKNGIIRIPKQYLDTHISAVKVILLSNSAVLPIIENKRKGVAANTAKNTPFTEWANTDKTDFMKLAGAWETEKSTDEMIAELKNARKFRQRGIEL